MSETPVMFIRPPRWLVKPDAEGAAELAAETGLPSLLTHLLAQRGITTAEKARDFLVPKLATLGDPRLLPEMPAAVERMLKRGPLMRKLMGNLKVYKGGEHPHAAQNPAKLDIAALNRKNTRA